ncbi:lipopolysaccharide biosynthesis protein [Granulicatella sp.]
MKRSRTEFATLNTSIALAIQPFSVIIGFINRTIFVSILGITYLGLSSYLTSIVSILSLAELGIGEAMSYALYSPLVREEHGKINAFMILFKKLYRIIGVSIFVFGGILSLFLPNLIKDYTINSELYWIFFLFIFNSGSSYFFAYKRTLLYVDQRNYVMNLINFGLNTLRVFLQIAILIFTQNFIFYLLIETILNIIGNVIMSYIVDRLYNYLYNEEITPINQEEKEKFIRNIKGNTLGSIGAKIVFQTDSILMAKFINLAAIGIYGNYNYVLGFVAMLVNTVMGSITSSIGNLIHSEDTTLEAKISFLKKYQFIAFSLIYFASIGYLLFVHPFIIIWLGENLSFNQWTEIVIVINFFLTAYRQPNLVLISVHGLSYEQNKKVIAEILLNIFLSLYFLIVLDLGVAGILLGTIGSTLLTCTWYEPYSVFKYGLKTSSKNYFRTMIQHFILAGLSILLFSLLDYYFLIQLDFIYSLVIKIILYLIVLVIYILIFRNHEGGRQIILMIQKVLKLKK